RGIGARHKEEGPEAPAGMGIRFLEIDPQSRRLIHWMVDKHAREGGDTFEFEELRQTADQALGEAFGGEETLIVAGRGSGRAVAADRAAFVRRLLQVVVTVGLLALLAWLFLRLTPPDTGGGPADEPSAARMADATEAPAEAAPPAGTPALAPGAATPTSAASDLIEGWADAWSEGRIEEYLSFYSTEFTPGNGLTQRQWRASRVERLSAPQHIRISITALELDVVAADRLHATFFQNYRSDRFEDTVRKRLVLGLEEGAWRILEERIVG
ncbi:MAG: hypothetical protein ACE5EG_11685, partial [Thermoanaerobaculia bacterium]